MGRETESLGVRERECVVVVGLERWDKVEERETIGRLVPDRTDMHAPHKETRCAAPLVTGDGLYTCLSLNNFHVLPPSHKITSDGHFWSPSLVFFTSDRLILACH